MKDNEMDERLHAQITALCQSGDKAASEGEFARAVENYNQAFELLPEPFSKWEAATWILTAIGDANFLNREYEKALQALQDAMKCAGAVGNPFVHLRLGQVQFELGNMERARDELARAYMGGGEEIFSSENPKYLSLVKAVLRPPYQQN